MNKNGLYELYEDLLLASISTKSRDVEDVFLKFASDYSKEFASFFGSALFPKEDIDSSVLNSFKTLNSIVNKFGQDASPQDVLKHMISNKSKLAFVPYIQELASHLRRKEYEDILLPYANIFPVFDNLESTLEVRPGVVAESLGIISSSFKNYLDKKSHDANQVLEKPKKRRKTKSELQKDFFKYAFKNLTNEVQYHLNMNGEDAVASAVENGALIDPHSLSQFFSEYFIDRAFLPFIEKIMKDTFKEVGKASNPILYNKLRNEILDLSNMINFEQRKEMNQQDALQDAANILELEQEEQQSQDNAMNVEDILSSSVNEIYVFLTSAFLAMSYKTFYAL